MISLAGLIASGPVAFALVMRLAPQPEWTSSHVFVQHYNVLQNLPYFLGFLIVIGISMLSASHYLESRNSAFEVTQVLALIATVMFACFALFNYVIQTTFIHNLATHYNEHFDSAIEALSMSNPMSICWAIEMWGYAFMGVATWLWSTLYAGNRMLRNLLMANGIISLICPFITILNVYWVLTMPGLIGYFLWNILMMAISFLMWKQAKEQQ